MNYSSLYKMNYSNLNDDFFSLDDINHLIIPQNKYKEQGNYDEYLQYYLENNNNKKFYLFDTEEKLIPILFAKKKFNKFIIFENSNIKIAELFKSKNKYILKTNLKKKFNYMLFCQYYNRNNVLTFLENGPRKITVKIPKKIFFNTNKSNHIEKINVSVKIFKNKKPIYYSYTNEYKLKLINAKIPSVKNFQLIKKNKNIYFELGKLNKNLYSINFKYPFSILQIFGIALSAF